MRNYLPARARRRFTKFAESNLRKAPAMSAAAHRQLTDLYAPEVPELEALVGRSLSLWNFAPIGVNPASSVPQLI